MLRHIDSMEKHGSRHRAALEDLRVVECGTDVSAPFCARILADLGANVIKVEPRGGDPARGYGPFPGDVSHPERSALFAYLNAGKQSVALGDSAPADQELFDRLGAWADLLVTNLSAAERRRWHLDLDRLDAKNPGLVTVSLSELGESTLTRRHRAHEIHVCALAGASTILGEPGREPLHFPFSLAALQAGLHGAGAALAARLARRRCGRGQRVEISEADVLASYCGGMSLFILGGGGKWRRRGFERHGRIYPSGFYPCKDGFIFIATQTRAQWKGFLKLMGEPDWARDDPTLQDGVAIGWRRADEVDVHFIPWLVQHTRRQLTAMAREANLVLGPINAAHELLDEPHLTARQFWTDVTMDGVPLRLPGMGYALSRTPWRIGNPPRLGANNNATRDLPARGDAPAVPTATPARRPLCGYRAVEFGWNWAGPLVGQILADLGMEVIKVETRDRVDFMRHWQHARPFFHNANRGKLSVSVNIKRPGGVDLVRRLASRADIVFDNFAAGVMQRNGLGYEDLSSVNPDIVVLSMAMAGQTGPLSHLRGFATIATGFAGLESAIGYPATEPSGLPLLGLGDANAAIQGVVACLAALWHRERTGEGQFIDLSQVEAAAALMGEPLADFQLNDRCVRPRGNAHSRMAPHGIYPATGEDAWVALTVENDDEWDALVGLMGKPEWALDVGLRTSVGRQNRSAELDTRLGEWTAGFERDALTERLQQAGLAAAPVLDIEDLRTHPYWRQRGLCQEIGSFDGGEKLTYATPWHLERTPAAVSRPSPEMGEHNGYVFGRLLGLEPAAIDALVEKKVLW